MSEQDEAPEPEAEYECPRCQRGQCGRCSDADCVCCNGNPEDWPIR